MPGMVTGHRRSHHAWIRAGIDQIHICRPLIELDGVGGIIEPVRTPLIFMALPSHDRRQTSKGRDAPISSVIVAYRLYDHGITLNMSVQPANSVIIAGFGGIGFEIGQAIEIAAALQ